MEYSNDYKQLSIIWLIIMDRIIVWFTKRYLRINCKKILSDIATSNRKLNELLPHILQLIIAENLSTLSNVFLFLFHSCASQPWFPLDPSGFTQSGLAGLPIIAISQVQCIGEYGHIRIYTRLHNNMYTYITYRYYLQMVYPFEEGTQQYFIYSISPFAPYKSR